MKPPIQNGHRVFAGNHRPSVSEINLTNTSGQSTLSRTTVLRFQDTRHTVSQCINAARMEVHHDRAARMDHTTNQVPSFWPFCSPPHATAVHRCYNNLQPQPMRRPSSLDRPSVRQARESQRRVVFVSETSPHASRLRSATGSSPLRHSACCRRLSAGTRPRPSIQCALRKEQQQKKLRQLELHESAYAIR